MLHGMEVGKFEKFLFEISKKLFAPESTKIDGHFDTFLQSCIKAKNVYGSDGQPSCSKITLENCGFCPNYQFKSKTEKERHISMFHQRQKLLEKSKEFKCVRSSFLKFIFSKPTQKESKAYDQRSASQS